MSAKSDSKKTRGLLFIGVLGISAYAYTRNINAEASGSTPPPPPSSSITLLKVDPVVVNLADEEELHYLKLSLELQLGQSSDLESAAPRMALIRNEIILFGSSLTVADTRGEKLKTELLHRLTVRLNKAFGGDLVKQTFFTDFVVQ